MLQVFPSHAIVAYGYVGGHFDLPRQ